MSASHSPASANVSPHERVTGDVHELTEPIVSDFSNEDLAPTTRAQRKWATKDIAALWISMSACVPTYMLASSLITEGMNWWQAVLTIFLGNTIVLVPMVLNAHAGTKYGIPFPVYCRPAFGVLGANVPAILRALVACGSRAGAGLAASAVDVGGAVAGLSDAASSCSTAAARARRCQ